VTDGRTDTSTITVRVAKAWFFDRVYSYNTRLWKTVKKPLHCKRTSEWLSVWLNNATRPFESHSGARNTILAGHYHNLIMTETVKHPAIFRQLDDGGLEHGGCVMHGIVPWSHNNWQLTNAQFRWSVLLSNIHVIAKIFWSDDGDPKRPGARENLFPFLDGPE